MEKADKKMMCMTFPTIREIVKRVNELQIPKEDIVEIFHLRDDYWLIYYG